MLLTVTLGAVPTALSGEPPSVNVLPSQLPTCTSPVAAGCPSTVFSEPNVVAFVMASPASQPRASVVAPTSAVQRSEEHTSELQSRLHLVCRLLLEKKKKT